MVLWFLTSGILHPAALGHQADQRSRAGDMSPVDAAFLFKLARFVEWPPWAFASDDDPVHICLVGSDPFGRVLDDVVRGKRVNGRRVVVFRDADVQAATCHILFAPAGSARELADLLHGRARAASLTVSDAPFFIDDGGMIGLYTDSHRARFEINLAAAESNGLRVSSRLVSLASRVTRAGGTLP